jgi:hypothetical protein
MSSLRELCFFFVPFAPFAGRPKIFSALSAVKKSVIFRVTPWLILFTFLAFPALALSRRQLALRQLPGSFFFHNWHLITQCGD